MNVGVVIIAVITARAAYTVKEIAVAIKICADYALVVVNIYKTVAVIID